MLDARDNVTTDALVIEGDAIIRSDELAHEGFMQTLFIEEGEEFATTLDNLVEDSQWERTEHGDDFARASARGG
jgi:hypothetical protein